MPDRTLFQMALYANAKELPGEAVEEERQRIGQSDMVNHTMCSIPLQTESKKHQVDQPDLSQPQED